MIVILAMFLVVRLVRRSKPCRIFWLSRAIAIRVVTLVLKRVNVAVVNKVCRYPIVVFRFIRLLIMSPKSCL